MQKYILSLIMGGTLLFSTKSTQCATDSREHALIGCGCAVVIAGLYMLTKEDDTMLEKISRKAASIVLFFCGFKLILDSKNIIFDHDVFLAGLKRAQTDLPRYPSY